MCKYCTTIGPCCWNILDPKSLPGAIGAFIIAYGNRANVMLYGLSNDQTFIKNLAPLLLRLGCASCLG